MTQEITHITVIPGRTKAITDYQRGDIGKPMFPLDDSWMLCCPGCGSITYYPNDTFRLNERASALPWEQGKAEIQHREKRGEMAMTEQRLTQIVMVNKAPHRLCPGEAMYSELHHAWLIGCPNSNCSPDPILHGIANLVNHEVTESNGVITVSPSILCGCDAHYFVEQNKIRWC